LQRRSQIDNPTYVPVRRRYVSKSFKWPLLGS